MNDLARIPALALAALVACAPAASPHPSPAQTSQAPQSWVQRSNAYAQPLLQTMAKYQPELASKFGVTTVDEQVVDLKPGFDARSRADLHAAIDTLQAELAKETDPSVRQDLQIMIDAAHRAIAQSELDEKYLVPYIDLPKLVFFGMRSLLDDQVAPERRRGAIVRLRRYAGVEPGSEPVTALAEAYIRERLNNPALLGPFVGEIKKNLAQDQYFIDGVAKLLDKYHVEGSEPVLAKLKTQLTDYNAFVQKELLPRARADFRLPPPLYALQLQDSGIDVPPERLIAIGHAAFDETQKAMQELAPKVAREKGLQVTDYRDVIRALKRDQVQGDAIMSLYKTRIASIEQIIRDHHLVTLPQRPMIFRFATAAESAATPAPHMDIPQLLGNTGQKGAFVLPLEIPAAPGQQGEQKFDDFTFDAASWTLTAHEGRPGHEMQFDTMIERGVSIARAVFALNSTNAEGWGLYSEWLLYPYMPDDGKLISLQHRLMRAARAFLDPELQAGTTTPERAGAILRDDCVLSPALANEEVERYTFWAPGQAPSYYYGFTQLLSIRKDAEQALGAKFDAQKFHDFILEQGLVPPALLRKAVQEQFVPATPTQDHPKRDAGAHAPLATSCPAAYGSTDVCTPAQPRSVVVRQRTDVGQGPGPAEDVASFESPRCEYPQGTCECQQGPARCGGGAAVRPPPPGWQPPPFRWQCTPALRSDGCPGAPPRAGEPCTIAHDCSYCITRYSCDRGQWSIPIVGPPAP